MEPTRLTPEQLAGIKARAEQLGFAGHFRRDVVALLAHVAAVEEDADELRRLNDDKFNTIQAYRSAASKDRAEINRLMTGLHKLPRTADGMVCFGGEIVWGFDDRESLLTGIVVWTACDDSMNGRPGGGWEVLDWYDGLIDYEGGGDVECYYSTAEAATAAKKENENA